MPSTSGALDATVGLSADIQQFYARQMHLLDDGRTDEWADTFTQDGVFAANGLPEPARGRQVIREAAAKAAAQRTADGVQVRHWLGMLDVQPQSDGTVRARSYALIVSTPLGGSANIQMSTTCDDVLVPDAAGGWLVSTRQVKRDDLR